MFGGTRGVDLRDSVRLKPFLLLLLLVFLSAAAKRAEEGGGEAANITDANNQDAVHSVYKDARPEGDRGVVAGGTRGNWVGDLLLTGI